MTTARGHPIHSEITEIHFPASRWSTTDRNYFHGTDCNVPIPRWSATWCQSSSGGSSRLMFRFLTTATTVSVMLLHSILGCCTHHAHACEHGHSVEECAVGDEADVARHSGDVHRHHVSERDYDAEHGIAAHDGEHGDHESGECPHGPCGQECQSGDCTYTPSSKVKAPTPADGQVWFPLAVTAHLNAAIPGSRFPGRAEVGFSDASAACCCRTMTQVWRL